MIQKILMKQLLKQFKLDKVLEYVEKPNELDLEVKDLKKRVEKLEKEKK